MALHDIDHEENYDNYFAELRRPETKNFAVSFDAKEASCAVNISTDEVSTILQGRNRDNEKQPCLWLNLWGWDPEHQEILKILSRYHEISPRLTHVLCPRLNETTPVKAQLKAADQVANSRNANSFEKPSTSPLTEKPLQESVQPKRKMPTGIGDIAKDLWHFCTVDFGRHYICICWNALFFSADNHDQASTVKPKAIRVWSSLLFCDDGTVVSTFEAPAGLSPRAMLGIRNNQLNIFTHLSKYGALSSKKNALMQISIRPFHSLEDSASFVNDSDMASLLFYYLFDDWLNIYYQAVGGEHSYRNQLETLREKMIESANVNQVTTLHRIGKELSVLRAVYRSYQSIIERIVQRHRRSAMLMNAQSWNAADPLRTKSSWSNSSTDINETSDANNQLTTSAVSRFERLQDRISLCAITEVDECLKEKDDMVMMVRNGFPYYAT